jgi:TM2 domain-containing membrane protein YozV
VISNVNLIVAKTRLSEQQLLILQGEVSKHRKSTVAAYWLLFFLPGIGAHQFYLRNTGKGIFYLLGSFAPLYLFVNIFLFGLGRMAQETAIGIGGACLFLSVIVVLSLIYDLLTLSGQTERANNRIEADAFMVLTGVDSKRAS